MNTLTVQIQSATVTSSNVVTSIEIQVTQLQLNTGMNLMVRLKGANGRTVENKQLFMTGTDYANWGTDDTYVSNWVLTKLGYTLATTGATGATGASSTPAGSTGASA